MTDSNWDKEPVFCFTADVDWASEEALEECNRHIPKLRYGRTCDWRLYN